MDVSLLGPGLQGFGFGLGLILAIGAQNVFVLRQGLKREYVFTVVAISAVLDAFFITLGAAGVGTLVANTPWLQSGAVWFGSAFLIAYGALAFRNAIRTAQHDVEQGARPMASYKAVVATTVALSVLNPHVYLDTIIVLGSIAGQFPGTARTAFGTGAVLSSLVFFTALGYGATWMAPLFERPVAWRLLDASVGVVMWAVAASLLGPQVLGV
jgi:L-lysine exporter family protein LysE/ArgO